MSYQWLDDLLEKVAKLLGVAFGGNADRLPLCAPDSGDDFWEVWAYPAVQEIVGGKEDGETVWCGFNFDVLGFLTDFLSESVALSTRQLDDPSELTFEGKFRGHGVFLHLCLEPPEDAEATEIVDLSGDGGPVVRAK